MDKAGGIGAGIGGGIGAIAAATLDFNAVNSGITGGAGAALSYLTVYLLQNIKAR